MASLGAFAAGFLMRPIGGTFFGYVGDRYGRKQALLLAIFLMTIPTVIIGLIPSYTSIGILAPIVVLLCRLIQGFSVGGEYGSAAVFIYELVPKNKSGFAGSLLCAVAFFGAILGSGLGALCTSSFMPAWGWRIPFLLAGLFGILIFLFRKQLHETPTFSHQASEQKSPPMPLWSYFKKNPLNILCSIAIGSNVQIPFYIASIYMQILLTTHLKLPASQALFINTGIMILWMILLPLSGYISDRIGPIKLMSYSALATMIVIYPIFILLDLSFSITTVLIIQVVISLVGVGFMGAAPGFLPQLFPVSERVSGTAIGYSFGQAIFSGITPLVATTLVTATGDLKAPAFYFILTSSIGFIAMKVAASLLKSKNSIVEAREWNGTQQQV